MLNDILEWRDVSEDDISLKCVNFLGRQISVQRKKIIMWSHSWDNGPITKAKRMGKVNGIALFVSYKFFKVGKLM